MLRRVPVVLQRSVASVVKEAKKVEKEQIQEEDVIPRGKDAEDAHDSNSWKISGAIAALTCLCVGVLYPISPQAVHTHLEEEKKQKLQQKYRQEQTYSEYTPVPTETTQHKWRTD
eukprot:TRINITY_DN24795_c0_g1_i1.p2 TRINITY_DN24795_c0_g1~~TRINITY_DN24795_c0_g1_i1.p2  ORF type:complete len:115 (+),score=17.62 TRINITY_DN24795_c0_g1_i1:51-395(+)